MNTTNGNSSSSKVNWFREPVKQYTAPEIYTMTRHKHNPAAGMTTQKVSLPIREGYLFVEMQQIIRCEASGSYTIFYMQHETKIMVSLRLKICEAKLAAGPFFRIHHSHIVNLNCVSSYHRSKNCYIVLTDGTQLDVAASRRDAFLKIMNGEP